ncbi:MAG: non-canonical purine NTP pyrophosphatase [Flavobacteriales bacterium]|nr:non-canonical purine NTP pyrophosphatase [Flavobacteriales bacterium]|tara:strand:+ start:257 stop:835 length:579 start_codon:yes stop_codon:yes gene_type:complete
MQQIVFASQNENKVREIRAQLGDNLQILSLNDIGHTQELAEDQNTLEGNALQKAQFVIQKLGYNCFADDTGLEVNALNGAPGVYSARYAGDTKDANANMDKLLAEMEGVLDRSAQFRTAIALIIDGKEYLFEGVCEGEILKEKRGEKGFGYDPIFKPRGYDLSFAEMDLAEKARIGHRGKAVHQLILFLNQL